MRAVLLFGFISITVVSAQELPHRLQVEVPLVSLDVAVSVVLGSLQIPITHLGKEDFLVYEDGKLQEIRNFAPPDRYNILVVNACGLPLGSQAGATIAAMTTFLKAVGKDAAYAQYMAGEVRMVTDWNQRWPERRNIELDIASPACWTATPKMDFYDMLEWAVRKSDAVSGRKSIAVFVNGEQPASTKSSKFQQLLGMLRETTMRLYFVAETGDFSSQVGPVFLPYKQLLSDLAILSETSGGRLIVSEKPEDLGPLCSQLGRDLAGSYGLGYAPSNRSGESKYRRIEVRINVQSPRIHDWSRSVHEASKNQNLLFRIPDDLRLWQSREGYSLK